VLGRLSHQKIKWWGEASGRHITAAPNPQAALEIFAGEWVSRLPPPLDRLRAGEANLFADPRLAWALTRFGSLDGQTVLDLGPLEGGHSYMAAEAGASCVIAVEGNTRHFLRCLLVKDLLGLHSVELLLGDFLPFLQRDTRMFDLCLAMGVLYHVTDPVQLIALMAERSSRLVLWTHYYDAQRLARCDLSWRWHFRGSTPAVARGFAHTKHRFVYGIGRHLTGFYGGGADHANWLSRTDLLGALEYFGWRSIEIGTEEADHPRGPCLTLTAVRDDSG
jgi:hypothetical protein